MIDKDNFIALLLSQYAYEQNIVSYVNLEGKQLFPSSFLTSYDAYYATMQKLIAEGRVTIKVEQLERYSSRIKTFIDDLTESHNHTGPVTVHAFMAFPDSPSFGMHTDPHPVLALCIDGIKTFTLENGTPVALRSGDSLFFSAEEPHEATNEHQSIMLSIGFDWYIEDEVQNELDAVRQDN